MPTWTVRDPADPRLAPFAALPRRGAKARSDDATGIVVEGEIAVARALEAAAPVRALLLTPSHRSRLAARVPETVEVYEAEAAVLRQVVGFDFHRGCLAWMDRPVDRAAADLVAQWGPGPRTVLVAEGVADPANLGAVIRNARAFGVDLVLHGRGADPWSRRAIRAAMGLGFGLPVIGCADLVAEVDRVVQALGPEARTVAAVAHDDATVLHPATAHAVMPARVVLLVGNEGAGLSDPLRARADLRVTIPLAPGVDSLNVAAATAVLLWARRASIDASPP